jgi:predicted ATPase
MINKLRFKNWRSLRDVEIDKLTPITVFIGANSSGKSNIVDGLKFLRYAAEYSAREGIFRWGGYSKIHTLGLDINESIEIECVISRTKQKSLEYKLWLKSPENSSPEFIGGGLGELRPSELAQQLMKQWQILDEDFSTPTAIGNDYPLGSLYRVDPKANNVPFILDFMRQTKPDVYTELQEDLAWMLEHVDKLDTARDANETRLLVNEKALGGGLAPTISGGTTRLIGMLTAMYVLEMSEKPELPGLVVIEEPDKSIHPQLLYKLVETLRNYVEGDHPRQIFLTTHNPRLLDLFDPEEVRVVERDENGETIVRPLNKEVVDIWLKADRTLGDAWMTRTLGGVPE